MQNKKLVMFLAVAAVTAAVAYWFTRPASPSAKSVISHQGLEIKVSYSRPFMKGRLIFGEQADGALQPYGQYWRLGANAATEITFNKDVTFGGQPVKAGTYRMYAVPGAQKWEVTLNSELGKSGSEAPDKTLDIATTEINPLRAVSQTEQFTISFRPAENGVVMDLKWESVVVSVPIL